MFKKLGFVVLLISISLVFTDVTVNALLLGLGDKIQKKTKLEGKWKIVEKPSVKVCRTGCDFSQIGEIEFIKGRNGKFSGAITKTVSDRLPNGGIVRNIRFEGANLAFEIEYSENDRRNFDLEVDETNKFSGRWSHKRLGSLGTIQLEK